MSAGSNAIMSVMCAWRLTSAYAHSLNPCKYSIRVGLLHCTSCSVIASLDAGVVEGIQRHDTIALAFTIVTLVHGLSSLVNRYCTKLLARLLCVYIIERAGLLHCGVLYHLLIQSVYTYHSKCIAYYCLQLAASTVYLTMISFSTRVHGTKNPESNRFAESCFLHKSTTPLSRTAWNSDSEFADWPQCLANQVLGHGPLSCRSAAIGEDPALPNLCASFVRAKGCCATLLGSGKPAHPCLSAAFGATVACLAALGCLPGYIYIYIYIYIYT